MFNPEPVTLNTKQKSTAFICVPKSQSNPNAYFKSAKTLIDKIIFSIYTTVSRKTGRYYEYEIKVCELRSSLLKRKEWRLNFFMVILQ
jgi:hypothetical protein